MKRAIWLLWALALSQATAVTIKDATVITADRARYDPLLVHFAGHVVVTDPNIKITSDLLEATLDEDGTVTFITAKGNVVISQLGRMAWAGLATYEIATGKVVLKENPRVKSLQGVVIGEEIVFFLQQKDVEVRRGEFKGTMRDLRKHKL